MLGPFNGKVVPKLCICVAGADETQLWLEFLGEAEIVPKPMLVALKQENLATVSAFVGARKSAEEKRSVKQKLTSH